MSCCGGQRPVYHFEAGVAGQPGQPRAQGRPAGAPALFEYIGRTGLTATGSASGKHYRFDRPGARAAVDAGDVAAMLAIPVLRRVRHGGA